MPVLTIRDRARSVALQIDRPTALESLCFSPPPTPYARGWLLRPDGSALALVAPSGVAERRLVPGEPFALGDVTLTVTADDTGRHGEFTERLLAEGSHRLSLVLPSGRRVALGTRAITLGKHPKCDVVIDDASVSAQHCRIAAVRGHWEIRDVGSTNGTRVGGVRVESALLAPGAVIVLGRSKLLCVRDLASDPAAPAEDAAGGALLVGDSPAMVAVRNAIARYAPRDHTVLIRGETGSGKELVARMVHEQSARRRGPFVAINAGALSPELVESELFGHEKGAFTGAQSRRRGVFEEASGGTLFLDELGELPLPQQTKLLRVLETREVRRVGAEGSIKVNVRIVCATHRNLRAHMLEGRFREDLFYRLDMLHIWLPPLRDRREDLPQLARHLMARVAAEANTPHVLDDTALAALIAYDWPGNVRELYGALSRAAAEAQGERVGAEHLTLGDPEASVEFPREPPRQSGFFPAQSPVVEVAPELPRVQTPEELYALYKACGNNASRAARAAGLHRTTFRDRLRRYKPGGR